MVVIIVSGMPGAGNTTIARLVAKKLGLNHFSVGGYFKKHYKEAKKETEQAIRLMETARGKSRDFHHGIDSVAISLAEKGNVVIDGKIAIHIVGKKADLKIWLKALSEIRAQRYAKRDNISVADAMVQLQKKEKEEREIFKRVYDFDYLTQEKDADVVIDTSNKTPDEIVAIILRNISGGYRE